MGLESYLSLYDTNQKQITGGSPVTGREGQILVKKVDYNIRRNYDPQTGKTHSLRRHQPFTLLKPIDCSSPRLFQGCASGELFSKAQIDLYRIDNEGFEVVYFTYELDNIRIISISPLIDSESGAEDSEVVSMSFEKISLLYHEGNLAASDEWGTR